MGIRGIDRDRLFEQLLRGSIVIFCHFQDEGKSTRDTIPCVEALWRFLLCPIIFSCIELWLDRCDNVCCDFVLQRENVRELAIITLSPNLVAGRRNSSFAYKGKVIDVRAIARELRDFTGSS